MSEKEQDHFYETADQDEKYSEMQSYVHVPPRPRVHLKDPNAPKRSLSAFFWFCNDERSKVKANNPEYTLGEMATELGRRWITADPQAKQKYEQLAEQDQARYDREMTAYKMEPSALVQQQQQSHDDIEEGKQWRIYNKA